MDPNSIFAAFQTSEGSIALFTFLFGGCLFLAILIVGGSAMWKQWKEDHCPKCRSSEQKHWHEMGEKDYDGYVWCAKCGTKYYSGFVDRCF